MYAESSVPRVVNDRAVLRSYNIGATTQQECVNFWYHMSGTNIGALNVYLIKNGVNQGRIWSLTGMQNNCYMV